MDIEKLIEQLKYYGTTYAIGDNLGREIDGSDELMLNASTALSTLQAENEKLRVEAEGMRSNWYKSVEEVKKLRAELEMMKQERDAAVKDMELVARRINDCNIKLDDGTTVSSLELGRCHVCRREETCDCDDVGCIFEWRGQKED